ncbi:hypothetical protein CsSME_00053334 [Camellia sinensis var. sinensis]
MGCFGMPKFDQLHTFQRNISKSISFLFIILPLLLRYL